eukprot:31544-Pelagococcus_subviridis.AAC.6
MFAFLGTNASSVTSLKCVAAKTIGGSGISDTALKNPPSNPTPSAVFVPFPNSSTMHSDRGVALLIISEIWLRSRANEDCPTRCAIESCDITRVKMRSTTPTTADSAGTNDPTCARNAMIAIDLMYTDFPLIVGPVTTVTRPPFGGTTASFGIEARRSPLAAS